MLKTRYDIDARYKRPNGEWSDWDFEEYFTNKRINFSASCRRFSSCSALREGKDPWRHEEYRLVKWEPAEVWT